METLQKSKIDIKFVFLLIFFEKTPKKSSGHICPPPVMIKVDLPPVMIRVKLKAKNVRICK